MAGLRRPTGNTIIATGPHLAALAEALTKVTGESLAFFDAIAPIVHSTIDQSIAWKQSRYDKVGPGGAPTTNCPLDKEQYDTFVAGLLAGDKTEFKQGGDSLLQAASRSR